MKSLDQKLANISADPSGAKDFILADAKDGDLGWGLATGGKDPVTGKMRSLEDYRDQMREITRQGLVDIMLMSLSSGEMLGQHERLFDGSNVTPAVRANDTSDVHMVAGSVYSEEFSRPFRSTTIEEIQQTESNLGLYSITPNNHIEHDLVTLNALKEFRLEAMAKKFRYFLEVFDPNARDCNRPADLGRFINDFIVRTLAGMPRAGRPIFLKIAYHGPAAMEAIVAYDPTIVVGILGGSSGTTHDAFHLLADAKKHGARAALFGRKIKDSEHPLTFVKFLHAIANDRVSASEAVKAYHAELAGMKIKPIRSVQDDLQLTKTFE